MFMRLAHNIGTENHPNYHTREQILSCEDPIGFDGIYKSVYDNQDVLKNKSGIMFVMGNDLGKDNSFDLQNVPKLESFCTLNEVKELCDKYDFELGWHTWSHRNLCNLTDKEIQQELVAPFRTKYFRYPYGEFNDTVIHYVKQSGYDKAYSVTQGEKNPEAKDYSFKIYSNYV